MTPSALVALLTLINLHTQQGVPRVVAQGWWHGRGNCVAMAEHTHAELTKDGVSSTIWVVRIPDGQLHAVVQSGPYVADSNLSAIETRTELERDGYRFLRPL